MNNDILGNTSVVIPTFEREKEIVGLVESLNLYNHDLKIIVVDTSNRINGTLNNLGKKINLEYIHMLNNGISCSRNTGLEQVNTDFTLFMDDDFMISDKSKLSSFVEKLGYSNLDILGGEVSNIGSENYDYHGRYEFFKDILIHFVGFVNTEKGNIETYDTIFNYFITKTKTALGIGGWDESLKFAREHDDFFLNTKEHNLTVGYDRNFGINHNDTLIKHYNIQDNSSSIRYFCDKWSVNSKIEVRVYNKNGKIRLSIYRFIGKKILKLSDDEKEFILQKLGFSENKVEIDYHHILD